MHSHVSLNPLASLVEYTLCHTCSGITDTHTQTKYCDLHYTYTLRDNKQLYILHTIVAPDADCIVVATCKNALRERETDILCIHAFAVWVYM